MVNEETTMGCSDDLAFYAAHCKPCFDELFRKFDQLTEKLDHNLHGNGKPGIIPRLTALEQKTTVHDAPQSTNPSKVASLLGSLSLKDWVIVAVVVVAGINSLRGGEKIDVKELAEQVKQVQTEVIK